MQPFLVAKMQEVATQVREGLAAAPVPSGSTEGPAAKLCRTTTLFLSWQQGRHSTAHLGHRAGTETGKGLAEPSVRFSRTFPGREGLAELHAQSLFFSART